MNVTTALPRLGQLLAAALILTGTHALGQSNTATQTQTATFSGTSGTQGVNFTGFDTSLGTLQSVTINLTNVEVNGYGTLTANTTGQSVTSAYLFSRFQLKDLSGATDVTVTVTTADAGAGQTVANGDTYFVGGTPGTGQVGNGYIQTGSTPPGNFVNASSAPPTTGTPSTITTNLAGYQGTSTTVTLNLAGLNSLSSVTSGGFNTAVNDTTTADVTLFYTYSPVPEPSKTAACMIGFALCVLVGRNYFKGRGIALA
jgi:hypothetical protein